MEIAVNEFEQTTVITIAGRADSAEAPRLVQAIEVAYRRGKNNIIIDMSRLEYMSSAGFRALAEAQRISRRRNHGEVVLVQMAGLVREALEMVGFTEFFKVFDTLPSALEYTENPPSADSSSQVPLPSPE